MAGDQQADMNTVIGIPARYGSSRFPGKPLATLAGRPMILHVIEQALEADVGPVIVATDDERIAAVVATTDAEVRMSRADHASGTERLAEALADEACDVVINVQGDEPLIRPAAIRAVLKPFSEDAGVSMATLAHPIRDAAHLNDPNVVKVVLDARNHALYFSRAPIPYLRTRASRPLQHVGLYAYRKSFLLTYPRLEPCDTERSEHLEQLRVLHHGYSIAVVCGDFEFIGVDTPADLVRVEAILKQL